MTDTPPTDAELDAIEARANAATPGPWEWEDVDTWPSEWGHSGPDLVTVDGETYICKCYCVWRDKDGVEHREAGPKHPHEHFRRNATIIRSWGYDADGLDVEDVDAAFIAAARSDVPRLVAEVRRLRKLLKEREA